MARNIVGSVKTKNKVTLKHWEVNDVTGFFRKDRNCDAAITESTKIGNAPHVSANPRIATLNNLDRTVRVLVRVCNISTKIVTLPPKTSICGLHAVKDLRSLPLGDKDSLKAHATQHREETDKPSHFNGVGSTEQKREASKFLIQKQHVFSNMVLSSTYLDCPDLVQHDTHLENERQFKEPSRRIPPALIQEMLEAGAIRSHFSSNVTVVIVRKNDGSICFCFGNKKITNMRTVKDAFAIPPSTITTAAFSY